MNGWQENSARNLESWYAGFRSCSPPAHSGAARAWRGVLRPLSSHADIAATIEHLRDPGSMLHVGEHGALHHDPACSAKHVLPEYAGRLTNMDVPHEVVLLDFGQQRNPRVYGVTPEVSRRIFPFHPHLRDDQMTFIDGKPLPALCTYLASDGVLQHGEMMLVTAVDFAAMYLAAQTIWERSAVLRITYWNQVLPLVRDIPTEMRLAPSVFGDLLRVAFDGVHALYAAHYRRDAEWFDCTTHFNRFLARDTWCELIGDWPGQAAPHFTEDLLREIRPRQECPCGSGERYGDCCWTKHYAATAAVEDRCQRTRESC